MKYTDIFQEVVDKAWADSFIEVCMPKEETKEEIKEPRQCHNQPKFTDIERHVISEVTDGKNTTRVVAGKDFEGHSFLRIELEES